MPARDAPKPKTFFRRTERVMVGAAMSVMAFFLEKVVMRTIREEGGPAKGSGDGGTAITTKGSDIDFEPET